MIHRASAGSEASTLSHERAIGLERPNADYEALRRAGPRKSDGKTRRIGSTRRSRGGSGRSVDCWAAPKLAVVVMVMGTRGWPRGSGGPPINQSEYPWNTHFARMIAQECARRGVSNSGSAVAAGGMDDGGARMDDGANDAIF